MAGQMLHMNYSYEETSALRGMSVLSSICPEDAK